MPSITQKITPFLWFDTDAEEAAKFYTSVFKGSRILETTRYGAGGHLPEGTVMTVGFELAGQRFVALNGGPGVAFNDAVSFLVACDTQQEIDELWDRLTSGGGEPIQCGWLKDRFGLRWQVTPAGWVEWIKGPRSSQVMQALMQMVKLDLATLRAAAEGR